MDLITTDADSMPAQTKQFHRRALIVIGMVVLADLLLFRPGAGINLVFYGLALAAAIVVAAPEARERAKTWIAMAFCLGALVPWLETPGWQAFAAALFAFCLLALTTAGHLPSRWTEVAASIGRSVLAIPFALVADSFCFLTRRQPAQRGRLRQAVAVWLVPLVLASIFIYLFQQANPLIDDLFRQVNTDALLGLLDPRRMLFWLLVAVLVWPFLHLVPFTSRHAPMHTVVRPKPESLIFGEAAMVRSLLVFNLIFAVQSALDLAILWGGASLPAGMTYAGYAHRGAYPLVATALLAAAFVLVVMRRNGPGERNGLLRRLVYVWIGQNVLLTISAMLRLGHYVEAYGLTELRVASLIWMGLVTVGLCLIMARIVCRQSNAWLVSTNLLALLATLYICAFVDFAVVIARYNTTHDAQVGLDIHYFSDLGPSIIPVLDDYLQTLEPSPHRDDVVATRNDLTLQMQFDTGWMSWTYRTQRLRDYLAARPSAS